MKKYDNYKDSGIEWIGEVPEHWNILRGKEVLRFTNGYPFNSNLFSKDENDGMPLVRIRDLKSANFSTYYKGEIIDNAIIDNEDIIIGMDGDFNITKWNKGKALLNQRLCKIYGINGLSINFLFFSLPYYLQIINDLTYYTTVKHLSNGDLFEEKYLVPPLNEQTAIANYLDHKTSQIDTLIVKKEQFISLLQEERTAVINQAVTKGLDPKVKMKDSGIEWLGEIPEHWEVKRLKYLCKIINEKTSQKPDYVLALENIKSWTGEIVGNPLDNKMEGDVNLFQENDILFNKLRPYLAKVIKTQSNGGCVGELLVLRANHFITPTFLYFRMISEAIITIVDNSTYGTKMPRASWDKFISLIEIGFPTIDEQNKITDYIENKIREIETLTSKTQQEIELLKEYKTALISEVVTGKVDVRDINLN